MKKYTPEQIVSKLRQANRELGKGQTVKEVCRTIEISEQTYYRWRQKYGGMSPELIKELKTLQKENQRLVSLSSAGLRTPDRFSRDCRGDFREGQGKPGGDSCQSYTAVSLGQSPACCRTGCGQFLHFHEARIRSHY
jgi:transposase-like protein